MRLTNRPVRLLAGVAFGAAAFLPASVLTTPTAGATDHLTTPTTDPCHELGTCPPPPPPEGCPPGFGKLPIKGGQCLPCEALPAGFPGCPEHPPECDPDVEQCEDPGEDPDPKTHPDPVDQPVVARPTFTG